jgi:uncharacterized spore protein YtfJ
MNLDAMATVLLEKLKGLAQTDTVVGKPIAVEGSTLIPVSRVSIGFGLGGVENKSEMTGSGGGLTVEPIAFIVVRGDDVKIVALKQDKATLAKAIDLVPEVLTLIRKEKKEV